MRAAAVLLAVVLPAAAGEACVDCHGGAVERSYAQSKHGVIARIEAGRARQRGPGCEDCHRFEAGAPAPQHYAKEGEREQARQEAISGCGTCHSPHYVTEQLAAAKRAQAIGEMKLREAQAIVEVARKELKGAPELYEQWYPLEAVDPGRHLAARLHPLAVPYVRNASVARGYQIPADSPSGPNAGTKRVFAWPGIGGDDFTLGSVPDPIRDLREALREMRWCISSGATASQQPPLALATGARENVPLHISFVISESYTLNVGSRVCGPT